MKQMSIFMLYAVFAFITSPIFSADTHEIDLVINQVGSTDTSTVENAIEQAGEILHGEGEPGFNVELELNEPADNNDPSSPVNGDNELTIDEVRKLKDEGKQELGRVGSLQNSSGRWNGKGIKVYVAGDCWKEKPSVNGWAWHYDSAICIEPDADPNRLARTIAHEIGHILTLEDTYDPNNIDRLMYGYTNRGSSFSGADVNEINTRLPVVGSPMDPNENTVQTADSSAPARHVPEKSIQFTGAVLDGLFDTFSEWPMFNPDKEYFRYIDIHNVTMTASDIFSPDSMTAIYINLGGLLPGVNSTNDEFGDHTLPRNFNLYCEMVVGDPAESRVMKLYIYGNGIDRPNLESVVFYGPGMGMFEVVDSQIIDNEMHLCDDSGDDGKVLFSNVIKVVVPTEFFFQSFVPQSGRVDISMHVQAVDDLAEGFVVMDEVDVFDYGLSNPIGDEGMFIQTTDNPFMGKGVILSGYGFNPYRRFEVWMDNSDMGSVFLGDGITDAAGNCQFYTGMEVPLVLGEQYSVTIQQYSPKADGTGEYKSTAVNTTFVYDKPCECPQVLGDLDNDSDVDLADLGIFASQWLVGT